MAEAELETARLILRRPVEADLLWQQQWLNTAAVMRHMGGVQAPETLEPGFAANAAAMAADGPGFWTVVLRETAKPIGKCGLASITGSSVPADLQDEVQVGWSLAEAFWRYGYGSEAARAAIAQGFTARGLGTIWAQTSDSNAASTAMMTRLGLTRCPQYDYTDPAYPAADNPTTIYRLTKTEWEQS
ncbi:GNAT family N-acetyltransferase [Novosphingobium sp.]|uniref:GNAT family N-acetyltransferase n=1 Tax=Novosphingobium sp. TaxID=1874826 RepID=UPI0025EC7C2B|nr:GNAT family N-acetyltransferase [Novosphingobium sp.]